MGGIVDFSGFESVTGLLFDDNSTSLGAVYLNFSFDPASDGVDDPSTVPLPAGGLLLLTALGAAAGLRRRRKAT